MTAQSNLPRVPIDRIAIGERHRPLDEDAVRRLATSIDALGLQHPVTVRLGPDGLVLVAGRHRLEAAKRLGWSEIDAVEIEGDALAGELWEIAENLHRLDLTHDQRVQHIRRYAEVLREIEAAKVQSRHPVANETRRADGRGHRPEGVASKVARATGLSKRTVERALADPRPKPSPPAMKRAIGTKPPTTASPAHPLATALADVDRHLAQADPAALLADMPEPARQEIARLAPRVARHLLDLTPPAAFATDPADGAEVQGRAGAFIADWTSPPGEGTIIMLGDQRYDLVAIEPKSRTGGERGVILTWLTACPECGARFGVRTGRRIRDLTRRCIEHRSLKPLSSGGNQFGRQRLDVRIFPASPAPSGDQP